MGRSLRSSLQYRVPGTSLGPVLQEFSAPRAIRNEIAALFRSGNYDVAVADYVFSAPFVPDDIPLAVYSHNAEYRSFERGVRPLPNPLAWLALKYATHRTRRFEREQLNRAAHTAATSEFEMALFARLAPEARVSVVGTGVDLDEFVPAPLRGLGQPVVVFTGNMSYFPNVEAVEWFCREVWPTVRRRQPQARFRIVGKEPSSAVRALASDSIEVTGRVDSVAKHLHDADVVVVPILSGSGTRHKVLQAMATGRPVVATTFAPEGLGTTDGHDIVLADDPQRFAAEVIRFLEDRPRAEAFGRAAAETVAGRTWEAVAERLEAVLEGVVAGRA
jgi:polysaccharide biosynthesis protein PslH